MADVVLVAHPGREEAMALAKAAKAWLDDQGHRATVAAGDLPDRVSADLVVSLGGDGTVLRVVDWVCASGVPILGVNVGHLGYLTAVEPTDLQSALERWLAGDCDIDERMTLSVRIERSGQDTESRTALNEAVVEKTSSGHTVRLALSVNGAFFTSYVADGLIVATPTGSTAYNFSARGPIVSPRLDAVIVTPVSPHMLFNSPLVLGGDEQLRVEVLEGRAASLVVDGHGLGDLHAGEALTCRRGDHSARFVSFGGRDFHQILKAKFGLADR